VESFFVSEVELSEFFICDECSGGKSECEFEGVNASREIRRVDLSKVLNVGVKSPVKLIGLSSSFD